MSVEIGPVVLEKILFRWGIIAISLLSPLGKRRDFSFEQTCIPLTQGFSVPSLVEISPVVLEKKMKMPKVYGQTDGRRTTGDQKNSLELSGQVS